METYEAFVVHAWRESGRGRLFVAGRLEDGRSFAAVDGAWRQSVSIPADSLDRAAAAISRFGATVEDARERSFDGRPCARLAPRPGAFRAFVGALSDRGLEVFRADASPQEAWFLDRGLRGPAEIRGEARPGRRADLVFPDAAFFPSDSRARPRWLSFDIETDRDERVRAVSMTLSGERGSAECLLVHPGTTVRQGAYPGTLSALSTFPDEASLLRAFAERIRALDPDVLTGWNVLDFDLRVLAARFEALGVPFDIARAGSVSFLPKEGNRSASATIPGRKVADAMRLARAAGVGGDDLSLQSVALATIGEGKTVVERGEDKLAALDATYRDDPAAFAAYCARDAELVLAILRAKGLDELTARRAELTGLPLDRAWTSVRAFESVYAFGLRARSVVPPGPAEGRVSGAPGGMILEPEPGLFEDVVVLDFRSLYPTIILTFNVDPLAFARASSDPDPIVAPNGARFARERGILPEAVDGYLRSRAEAIANGDATASYVLKILMNSFYGVLASEGCRYADGAIAGAITSFGHKYLRFARDFLSDLGSKVLYGDTDSVFLVPPPGSGGDALSDALDEALAREVAREYGLPSRLETRVDARYDRFLIPRLRVRREGEDGRRGRAKGYAGRIAGSGEIVVKGMEAARSDWTPFARTFQRELLSLLFSGASAGELREFVADRERALLSGALDRELVYSRTLRRNAREYARNEPPHVRAARLAGIAERRSRIDYVVTAGGPMPVRGPRGGAGTGDPIPDRERYLDTQLLPVARAIEDACGVRFVPEGRGAQGSFGF